MLAIVIPVIVATLGVAFWFRASNERASYRPNFTYSGRLELLVWSIPAMTVFLVGGVAWVGAHDLDPRKPISSTVKPLRRPGRLTRLEMAVHLSGPGDRERQQLVVPVGTPISFELTSSSVMNSFFVPQLGSQIYTMSGMATRLHLQADHLGTYAGLSAMFSGDGFSDMRFTVDAVTDDGFAQWVRQTRETGSALDRHGLCRSGQAEQGGRAVHLSRRRPRAVQRHRKRWHGHARRSLSICSMSQRAERSISLVSLIGAQFPSDEPIIMGATAFMVLVVVAVLGFITMKGAWLYLWREWLTSVDHKRIGVMYCILALVMMLRGLVTRS